jgi:hypothetical protein
LKIFGKNTHEEKISRPKKEKEIGKVKSKVKR